MQRKTASVEPGDRDIAALNERWERKRAEQERNNAPECWDIFGSYVGWFAWNGWTRTHKHLCGGSFSEAVKVFDAEIGPYYASRGKRYHAGAGHE